MYLKKNRDFNYFTCFLSNLINSNGNEKILNTKNLSKGQTKYSPKNISIFKCSLNVITGKVLQLKFRKYIESITIEKNEIEVVIKKEYTTEFFNLLKNHTMLQYQVLTDIVAIDYPGNIKKRFQLNYQMLSLTYNSRINIVLKLGELDGVPSITKIFNGASWFEREVYDLFGIFFLGHPDLRRILTDYGFEGHPLRKDFPLTGYFELFFSDISKRILYQPVSLAQEYRYFNFNRQWLSEKKPYVGA